MAQVTLVEDDLRIRSALTRTLEAAGHKVSSAASGLDALSMIIDASPDLVVLDLGLPDIDGRELLRMLRAVSRVPVIVATARDDESEIVRALDAGADDYMVKPFRSDQLDARIRAVLRRTSVAVKPEPVLVGDLFVDPIARTASLAGVSMELTRKEFDLLYYLALRQGEVVSKRELLAEVWDQPYGGQVKTVDVHVSWLRRKLGEQASVPRYLFTVRGVGVKLVAPS
jgi:DNA-binding response OmpR family regulator